MVGVGGGRAVVLKGDLSKALARIEEVKGPVVVLASGDPGFFGIVRLLAGRFGGENLRVLPGLSSVALAFAGAGLSWDDAVTVSAHGRDPRRAINVCRAYPKVAVLTSPDFGPAELANTLDGLGRGFVVAEKLGEPTSGSSTATPPLSREWSGKIRTWCSCSTRDVCPERRVGSPQASGVRGGGRCPKTRSSTDPA